MDNLFHRSAWKDAITFKGGTSQPDLLRKVVDFKMKFYPRSWAQYPDAKPGTLRLTPPDYRLPALKNDYESMTGMLFGDIPSFEAVMVAVRQLENDINA